MQGSKRMRMLEVPRCVLDLQKIRVKRLEVARKPTIKCSRQHRTPSPPAGERKTLGVPLVDD
jgi:hypothetical protein